MEKITSLSKCVQRIFKVQFNMITNEQVLGSIVKFILMQTNDNKDQLSVVDMRKNLLSQLDQQGSMNVC
jgi:hypothetical protein